MRSVQQTWHRKRGRDHKEALLLDLLCHAPYPSRITYTENDTAHSRVGLQSQLGNGLTDQSIGDNLSTKISFFVK